MSTTSDSLDGIRVRALETLDRRYRAHRCPSATRMLPETWDHQDWESEAAIAIEMAMEEAEHQLPEAEFSAMVEWLTDPRQVREIREPFGP